MNIFPRFITNFKKAIRLFGLILLITLASFGVGMAGGTPVSPNHKREDANKVKTELVEMNREKTKAEREDERQ